MLTKQTLEIRWFNPGQLPKSIQFWFWHDCLGKLEQTSHSPQQRQDNYLYLPKCQILSIKFREGNIEIKFRQNELGIFPFLPHENLDKFHRSWQGKIERWIKVECTHDLSQLYNFEPPTWIKVNKKRWQRLYENVEFEIGELEIDKTIWWTLAAEMEEDNKNCEQQFKQAIQEFNQTYSGENLSAEKSYAYPSLLLKNF